MKTKLMCLVACLMALLATSCSKSPAEKVGLDSEMTEEQMEIIDTLEEQLRKVVTEVGADLPINLGSSITWD